MQHASSSSLEAEGHAAAVPGRGAAAGSKRRRCGLTGSPQAESRKGGASEGEEAAGEEAVADGSSGADEERPTPAPGITTRRRARGELGRAAAAPAAPAKAVASAGSGGSSSDEEEDGGPAAPRARPALQQRKQSGLLAKGPGFRLARTHSSLRIWLALASPTTADDVTVRCSRHYIEVTQRRACEAGRSPDGICAGTPPPLRRHHLCLPAAIDLEEPVECVVTPRGECFIEAALAQEG